jgi:tetratricopeptide (TPR) repeat protein
MISLQEAYDQARRWIESDDPERAIGLAQYILDHYPENLEAYRILGEAYLADRQLDQAQEAFERVLRSDPENVPAHVGLGITYERQGRLDRAIPAFEKAWEIKPEMAELRSQLLRLYADAWGSEHAQLRLRGGGLARLYAKGHMLPQAISEFRKVIDDQPDRYDAKVALAEALWRNGQEEEATDLIHALLKDRSELLKPNLLLGYMELASGNASGQQYWNAAYDMDPYQTVAQALFDTLPDSDKEEPSLEEWDEAAWRQQRDQEQQELAATRPIPVPSAAADDFSGSWLDQQSTTLPPPPPPRAPVPAADNDDFLAGLLGMGALGAADAAPASDIHATESPRTEEDQFASTEDDMALEPFSLGELGLSDDDFANFDSIEMPVSSQETPPAQQNETDLTATPFSPEDFDLEHAADGHVGDEAASGEEVPALPATEPLSPASADVRSAIESGEIEPFSFADLGLSDDEVVNLDAIQESPETSSPEATPQPEMTSDTAAENQAPDETAATPAVHDGASAHVSESSEDVEDLSAGIAAGKIQPFSFSELGLSDEELATLGLGESQPEDQEATEAESFGDELLHGATGPDATLIPDEQPNSASTQETVQAQQPTTESLSEGLATGEIQPFSFADLGLSEDEIAGLNMGGEATSEAPQQSQAENISEELTSGEIQPFSFADLGLSDDEIASLNEIGDIPADHAEGGSSQEAQATIEPEVQPFSLSDLGLSDEEFDNLNELGESDAGKTSPANNFADTAEDDFDLPSDLQPFSLDELDISSPEGGNLDIRGGLPTSLQPFSLDEPSGQPAAPTKPAQEDNNVARLSDVEDEDTSQQSGGYSWQEPLQRSQPRFVSSMNKEDSGEGMSIFAKLKQRKQEDVSQPEEHAPSPNTSNELDDRMLFSMDDVSLRDAPVEADISQPNAANETSTPQAHEPLSVNQPSEHEPTNISDAVATGEIQPFSLSDLGLSEEEIAALGIGSAPATESSQHEDVRASAAEEQPETAQPEDVTSEVQPFSFADFGLSDEPGAAQETDQSAPENISEGLESGEIQPFSFADLGLSEDEIASLNLGEAEPQASAPEADEAQPVSNEEESAPENISEGLESGEIQPFSFADLGLSEDEIASLNLDEPSTTAQETAATNTDDLSFDFDTLDAAEPQVESAEQSSANEALPDVDLQPFSFNDLGLSDDEIDSLGSNFPNEERASSLDLTEDDLAGLDFGTDEWTRAAPQEQTEQPQVEHDAQETVMSQLVSLGQQQGYVDISDIIGAIGNDQADESRVEEVVQQLQDANIQIRDGDEVIDLSAEDSGDELDLAPPSQAVTEEEPDLTPFSLSELGLSEDEIASLGLANIESSQSEPAGEQEVDAEIAPFSLSELGLSDEEVHVSGEESPQAPEQVAEEPQQPQPAVHPAPATEAPRASDHGQTSSASSETESQLAPALAEYVRQLESDPQNHILRLSVARAVGQAGMSDMSVHQYRHLIRQNALLDVVVDDIRDLIDEVDDPRFLQRLHRLLGDAFAKQGRLNEAMEEYKWVAQ